MARHRERQAGSVLLVVGLALVAAVAAWAIHEVIPDPASQHHEGPQRIVSLSPALTETLFAIGAGDQVVGVSDYTETPAEAVDRPHAGTAITPDLEELVLLRPTLIIAQSTSMPNLDQMRAIARTRVLDWLSVEDIVAGTRELGRLTGREREADDLANLFVARLKRTARPDAPRVLLLLGYPGGETEQLWFVKRNSLHGKALTAAGARNAIDEDVVGPPVLSLERVLQVDPDIIIVLGSTNEDGTVRALRRLSSLRAVESERLVTLNDPGMLIPGPRIIDLIESLQAHITAIERHP